MRFVYEAGETGKWSYFLTRVFLTTSSLNVVYLLSKRDYPVQAILYTFKFVFFKIQNMLILYFHIFRKCFEVLNAIFTASVYVTIVTAILYCNMQHCLKTFGISSIAELSIYSTKYFLMWQNKNYSSIYKSIIITSLIGFIQL